MRRRCFTLVEIMIVVVIIGLLAAIAIPAFQKVHTTTILNRMDNDARQIASGVQVAVMEVEGLDIPIDLEYDTDSGEIRNVDIMVYIRAVSKGYTEISVVDVTPADGAASFTMAHPRVGQQNYSAQGHRIM